MRCWFSVEEGKPVGVPGKKPSEQEQNQQQTQPTYDTVPESNPSHIGGRRAISPLRHPYSPEIPLFLDGVPNIKEKST